MTNWDDLKFLLATVESGSFSMAGKALGVNRTTVARRVAILEQKMGTALLEQSPSGYQITPAGEQVLASARQLASQVSALEEKIGSDSADISGLLRVAVPLGLGPEFMPELSLFSAQYPAIEMELINTVDPMASINQRKADVGLGLGHDLPDYLQGKKIVDLHRAIYASKRYLKTHPADAALSDHHWVGWGREMAHSQVAQWIARHVSEDAVMPLRVNSWHALREAVNNGIGVGHLWCFLADQEKQWVKISEIIHDLTIGLWVFHHRDVQNNRRVDAFTNAILPLLTARIEGDS